VNNSVSIIQAHAGFCALEVALVEGHLTIDIACLIPHAPSSRDSSYIYVSSQLEASEHEVYFQVRTHSSSRLKYARKFLMKFGSNVFNLLVLQWAHYLTHPGEDRAEATTTIQVNRSESRHHV